MIKDLKHYHHKRNARTRMGRNKRVVVNIIRATFYLLVGFGVVAVTPYVILAVDAATH